MTTTSFTSLLSLCSDRGTEGVPVTLYPTLTITPERGMISKEFEEGVNPIDFFEGDTGKYLQSASLSGKLSAGTEFRGGGVVISCYQSGGSRFIPVDRASVVSKDVLVPVQMEPLNARLRDLSFKRGGDSFITILVDDEDQDSEYAVVPLVVVTPGQYFDAKGLAFIEEGLDSFVILGNMGDKKRDVAFLSFGMVEVEGQSFFTISGILFIKKGKNVILSSVFNERGEDPVVSLRVSFSHEGELTWDGGVEGSIPFGVDRRKEFERIHQTRLDQLKAERDAEKLRREKDEESKRQEAQILSEESRTQKFNVKPSFKNKKLRNGSL